MSKKPIVFISYRRDDEGPTSRFIKAELDKAFGLGHVFMDLDNIRVADNWKEQDSSHKCNFWLNNN